MSDKVFKLELSEQHVNIIGNALGAAPYNVAAPVIEDLRKQVQAQIAPPAPAFEKSVDAPAGV